ncbi:hypothetical protein BKA65DRAFT_517890 [Rhexocercosporidium sp. MPI-PUGE-AT-0058]|nr:hypothetical protein BKA65DRAFT_517890 [Rhexocercosporidium sp. MPI-PUGE-AT-0058]
MAIILIATSILALFPIVDASSRAEPAIQHLSGRAEYQGGWPLALIGTASPSCPASASESCSSEVQNPACCPSGQTCIFSSSTYASYCCPTTADCNTAVLNFPRCSNSTWNMFVQKPSGYFCCEPGMIGVNPSSGMSGGLCEPGDQHVPTSILATLATQVGVATSAPTAKGNTNTTATGGGGSGATQTNPSQSSSSSSSHNSTMDTISHWSLAAKVGIGAAVVVAFVLLLVVSCLIKRRRNRIFYKHGVEMQGGQYDEYGNLVPGYSPYEPYRRQDGNGNNVTVNVVHGDQH